MPFSIASDPSGGFWVQNDNTGRRMQKKKYKSRALALRYQRALEVHAMGKAIAVKHGGVHSAGEKDKLNAIHNHAVSLGADCAGAGMDESEAKAIKAAKYMADSAMTEEAAEMYARQELSDIGTAAGALQQLSYLSSEMDEPDDAAELAAIMRGILTFLGGEVDEMEAAANGGQKSGTTEDGTPIFDFAPGEKGIDPVEAMASKAWYDALKRDMDPNVGGGVDRDKLKAGSFVFPDEKAFPVVTAGDVSDAVSSWGRYKGKHSFDDFKSRLTALAKRKGFEGSLPDEWKAKEKKGLDLTYVKSLGLLIPTDRLAVKFTGRDEIVHPVFLWGDPDRMDVEREFFTRPGEHGTDFWDGVLGKSVRPLAWEHGQDAKFPDPSPLVGKTVAWYDDEVGRWATSVLNRDKLYRKFLDEFIESKAVGASSDSAPQYVVREKQGKGVWLKQWPWFGTALTATPAEPRMKDFTPEFLKAWNLPVPDDAADAARALEEAKLQKSKLSLYLAS